MNSTFEAELTEALNGVADEVGPLPTDLAANALRDGQQIRRRRSVGAAVAAVLVLVVPAVLVTHREHPAAVTAASPVTTTIIVREWGGLDLARDSATLQKRFRAAGITVRSAQLQTPDAIRFGLASKLPSSQLDDELAQLTVPGSLQVRTVLARTARPEETTADDSWAARGPTLQTLAKVKAKLGAAYTYAERLTGPVKRDVTTWAKLEPFEQLSSYEASLLPPQIQYDVPFVNCAQLVDSAPPVWSVAPATQQFVTCDAQYKYLLSRVQVDNSDIASVKVTHSDTDGWALSVRFTASGQQRWTGLTTSLMATADPAHGVYGQVGILTDSLLLMMPQIESVIPGPLTVTGFTEASAKSLAITLNTGPLSATASNVNFVVKK